jgi:calcineurin-like phosphoesterase family protein
MSDTPNIWFSSDFHLGHKNIIKYSNRPFVHVTEMNETIIDNWNAKVKNDEVAYFLGDFCFGSEKEVGNYLRRMNGYIKILFGNHDKALRKFADNGVYSEKIEFLDEYKEIKIGDQHITLCHYALRVFNRSHHGAWALYGHSHGTLPDDPHTLSIDVGVDVHNFFPISFEEIKKIMGKKSFKPIDHHGDQHNVMTS